MADPVRLGMARLTDAAPVVLACENGWFEQAGLAVSVSVEPSWANIADKLTWGVLDGAVMLHPLAIAMALGLRSPATGLRVAAGISLNGNAITLAQPLAEAVLSQGDAEPPVIAARLRQAATGPLRLAVVHAFSTHDLLLRRFLASGGIDPASVRFSIVPPPDMPAALAAGRIDGFCAGAPWSAVAAEIGAGGTVALSSRIKPNHPEKCLVVREHWAAASAGRLDALLQVLRRAGAACDDPANTPELAEMLAQPRWIAVAASLIATSLPGGDGAQSDRSVFAGHDAMRTTPATGQRFLEQLASRWPMPANAQAIVDRLYSGG